MSLKSNFLKMLSTRNVGTMDRIIRALFLPVIGILIMQNWLSGPLAWGLGGVGMMLLPTAILGSCSIYYYLGLSTCPISGKEREI